MKTKILLFLSIMIFLLLAACSAKSQTSEEVFSEAPREAAVQAPMEAAAADEGMKSFEEPAMEAAQSAPAAAEQDSAAVKPDLSPLSLQSAPSGRMVIKDALIELLVDNTPRTIDQVTDLAATQGGYIISSRSWYKGDYQYATIRMGVPSEAFESTLKYLRAMAVQVLNEEASGQDVSAEYNDLQSRLTNLEATAARVRAFLDEAKTVEESLKINQTLSDLEGQIEQVKGQMKFYETRSAFSTIEVSLSPVLPTATPTPTPTQTPTPTPTPGWNPGATVKNASQVGVNVLKAVVDFLIWIVLVLWPFLLIAGIVLWIILARRKKQSKTAPPPPPAPPAGGTPG